MPPEIIPPKTCTKCGVEKPITDFHTDRGRRDGYDHRCKKCDNARRAERSKTQRGRLCNAKGQRKVRLKRYGLTEESFAAMLETQNGLCAICGTDDWWAGSTRHNQPLIDHCHETLRVRGLLCNACNTMLGAARDDIDTLIMGAEYLRLAKSCESP